MSKVCIAFTAKDYWLPIILSTAHAYIEKESLHDPRENINIKKKIKRWIINQ